MKRKEAIETIDRVAMHTYGLRGEMTVMNDKTGDEIDVDLDSTLAVARGVLAWCSALLDDDREPASIGKEIRVLLVSVGKSIALAADDADD